MDSSPNFDFVFIIGFAFHNASVLKLKMLDAFWLIYLILNPSFYANSLSDDIHAITITLH